MIVTVPSELVRNKRAPEIRGELTPAAALARLLRGSGLKPFFTASGAITIGAARSFSQRRTPRAATASAGETPADGAGGTLIEEVLVTAQKRTESVQDVPSSVSVLDSRRVRQLHATTIIDYAAYIPGLNVSSGGGPARR